MQHVAVPMNALVLRGNITSPSRPSKVVFTFRSRINTTRSLYSYSRPIKDAGGSTRAVTAQDLEEAAIEIRKALYGTCKAHGRVMPVNGDMTKVKNVVLSVNARSLLNNIEHVPKISGDPRSPTTDAF